MDSEGIGKKMKEMFSKVSKVSKETFEKAGNKVQDFTDKSVVKIEIKKIESKRNCKYEELGLKISQMMLQGAKIQFENQDDINTLNGIQKEIKNLSAQIKEKEKEL